MICFMGKTLIYFLTDDPNDKLYNTIDNDQLDDWTPIYDTKEDAEEDLKMMKDIWAEKDHSRLDEDGLTIQINQDPTDAVVMEWDK